MFIYHWDADLQETSRIFLFSQAFNSVGFGTMKKLPPSMHLDQSKESGRLLSLMLASVVRTCGIELLVPSTICAGFEARQMCRCRRTSWTMVKLL